MSAKNTQLDCHQFLANGRCSRGDQCSFKHDWNKLKSGGKGKGKGKGKGNKHDSNKSGGRAGGNRGNSKVASKGRTKGAKGESKDGGKQSPRPRSPGPGVRGSVQDNKYVPTKTRKQSRGRFPCGKLQCPQCIDHFHGRCNKGSNCEYWHIGDCRFYTQGNCTAGDDCVFCHRDKNGKVINGIKIVAAAKASSKAKTKNKAKAKADGAAGVCLLDGSPDGNSNTLVSAGNVSSSNTLVSAVTAISFSPLEK